MERVTSSWAKMLNKVEIRQEEAAVAEAITPENFNKYKDPAECTQIVLLFIIILDSYFQIKIINHCFNNNQYLHYYLLPFFIAFVSGSLIIPEFFWYLIASRTSSFSRARSSIL